MDSNARSRPVDKGPRLEVRPPVAGDRQVAHRRADGVRRADRRAPHRGDGVRRAVHLPVAVDLRALDLRAVRPRAAFLPAVVDCPVAPLPVDGDLRVVVGHRVAPLRADGVLRVALLLAGGDHRVALLPADGVRQVRHRAALPRADGAARLPAATALDPAVTVRRLGRDTRVAAIHLGLAAILVPPAAAHGTRSRRAMR